MGDIVERLRNHVKSRDGARIQNGAWDMMLEAASTIEALAEEVERAKEDYLRRHNEATDRLLEIQSLRKQLQEARDAALEDAANVVVNTAYEGIHESMWRNKFMRIAATIRSMKGEAK